MRLTAVTMEWADGEYTFDLPLGSVRALQEKTGFGPAMLLYRIQTDQWKVDDYRETIFQGLIGGGLTPVEATKLVKAYVDDRPAKESLLPAQAVLMAFINGMPSKKAETPGDQIETTTAPVESTSEHSTEPVLE
jgi:hypothetical protein